MNTPFPITRWAGWALLMACSSHMAMAVPVDASAQAASKTAAQVCEAAVSQAIHKARGKAVQEVQFTQTKHAQAPTPAQVPASDSSIHGEGRYRGTGGTMPFTYSCTLDPQNHAATGVIFKETGEAARTVEKPWQADLTNVSPEVCEAAVAGAIKEKYPRAVNVVLSSTSRQLMPAPNNHTYMLGQGSMERAAGMSLSAFTYRCELDTATGKFIGVQTDLVE